MANRRAQRDRQHLADRWWKADKAKAHDDVWATLRRIRELSQTRIKFDRHHMELYSNQNVAGNGSSNLSRERVRFNLIAQAVDTAASQIATQRPKPMYLTSEGDFSLQRQARLRTRVLEGQLYDLKAYEIMPQVFIDAAVCGTGFVYGYLDPDTGEPCIERCLPGTVWIDPRDGLRGARGDHLCTYYRIPIARDVVRECWPKVDDQIIDDAQGPDANDKTDMWLTQDTTCDDVMVVFAWRRPTRKASGDDKGSGDGRLVVSVSSGTLLDTEWRWSLPFVRYVWKERQLGYYGAGIAEAGRDPQARILKCIARGEELQDRGSTTWVTNPRGANVRVEKLSNAACTMVHFDGPLPPQIQAFTGKPPDLDMEVDRVREQFFSELGISQMAAEAKKPAGLDSGAAQRAYQDITSQRHQVQARAFEAAYMDLVRLLEELNERAAGDDNGYSVMARTQRGRATLVKQVKWSAVRMPENRYRLTCWPTSLLPATPAGKMAMVSEWIASGFISRPTAQQLALDLPDTDQAARLELADMDCVMYDVERILDGYEAYPEPYQDLNLATDIARRAYLSQKCQDAPEDVLEALRQYINDCLKLQGLPAMDAPPPEAAAAPAPGPAPVPEGGAPMPPEMPAAAMGLPPTAAPAMGMIS
jgi:hypothetical protein